MLLHGIFRDYCIFTERWVPQVPFEDSHYFSVTFPTCDGALHCCGQDTHLKGKALKGTRAKVYPAVLISLCPSITKSRDLSTLISGGVFIFSFVCSPFPLDTAVVGTSAAIYTFPLHHLILGMQHCSCPLRSGKLPNIYLLSSNLCSSLLGFSWPGERKVLIPQ